MPKDFSRSQRVAEQVRRELSELIQLEVKDPRVGMISLTDVEITPDYAHAKVFFTCLHGKAEAERVQAGLTRASGFLRRELGRRIHIHTLPELHFHYDPSLEEGDRMSRLIEEAVRSDQAHDPSADPAGDPTSDSKPS